jgi:ubiquinol-cytochrome c reductase cytochrome b subunit
MIGLVFTHLALLHIKGSSNPLTGGRCVEYAPFYPYFYLKDLLGILILIFVLSFLVFFKPNLLGHPDNYIRANPLTTPLHIVPEWYFLPFYAILRSIPNKLAGVAAMFLAIVILFILPFIKDSSVLIKYNVLEKACFWWFIMDVSLLGFLGGAVAEQPFILLSQIATFLYFFLILA